MPRKKSKKRKVKVGICAFCGQHGPVSEDHIPPRNLFRPGETGLLTVPACEICNAGSSKDDEYFRVMLALSADAFEHPAVQANWPTIRRGLGRPEWPGLQRAILKTVREVEVQTPSGIYLGRQKLYDLDLGRLSGVARKVVHGLYWLSKQAPLPETYAAYAWGLDHTPSSFEKQLILAARTGEHNGIGGNVFQYWQTGVEDDDHASIVLMVFYEKIAFLGCIAAAGAWEGSA